MFTAFIMVIGVITVLPLFIYLTPTPAGRNYATRSVKRVGLALGAIGGICLGLVFSLFLFA